MYDELSSEVGVVSFKGKANCFRSGAGYFLG